MLYLNDSFLLNAIILVLFMHAVTVYALCILLNVQTELTTFLDNTLSFRKQSGTFNV